MYSSDILVQCMIAIALLLQYYGIRLCYSAEEYPTLVRYRRVVLCIAGIALQHPLTVIAVGLVFHCPVSGFSRFNLYADFSVLHNHEVAALLFIVSISIIRALTSISWLLVTIPPLALTVIRMEGIPVSRMQKLCARFTHTAGIVFLIYQCINLLIAETIDVSAVSGAPELQNVHQLLVRGSFFIFYCVYLFLFGWFVHIIQIRVLTAYPMIRKLLYRILWIAAVICTWLLVLFTVRMLDEYGIRIPLLTAWLRKKQLFPFYEDLILYGLFAAAGLYVLHHQTQQRFNGETAEEHNAPLQTMHGCRNDAAADTAIEKAAAKGFDTAHGVTGNAFVAEETDEMKQRYRRFFIEQGLTEREADVAVLIAFAKSNKEIAVALHIAYNTVRNHVANVYIKTGAHNRFDLARFANAGIATL